MPCLRCVECIRAWNVSAGEDVLLDACVSRRSGVLDDAVHNRTAERFQQGPDGLEINLELTASDMLEHAD